MRPNARVQDYSTGQGFGPPPGQSNGQGYRPGNGSASGRGPGARRTH